MTAGPARPPAERTGSGSGWDDAAAWIRGAAEALSVLSRRDPSERLRAAEHAAALLATVVEPADWPDAAIPAPAPARAPGTGQLPVSDPAALHLARTAMTLRCSTMATAQRPAMWARLAAFFAQVVPGSDPLLRRIRATALFTRVDAGDVSQDVVDQLFTAYEESRDSYGQDAYQASLDRTNLAVAYRHRAAGTDLASSADFCRQEIEIRSQRYGTGHPFTLVARNLLARTLLAQAEAAGDQQERRDLALKAYSEADRARVSRDRLYGVTSSTATLSRRHQGHALLLLGEPDDLRRALACLQYALAFESARNDNAEWRGSGPTYLLLARVCLAQGDHAAALSHAVRAHQLLSRDAPDGQYCRDAAALLQQLSGTPGSGGASGAGRQDGRE